jgi:hypothetical protein
MMGLAIQPKRPFWVFFGMEEAQSIRRVAVASLGEVALLRYLGLAVMMGRSRPDYRLGCLMGKSWRKKEEVLVMRLTFARRISGKPERKVFNVSVFWGMAEKRRAAQKRRIVVMLAFGQR